MEDKPNLDERRPSFSSVEGTVTIHIKVFGEVQGVGFRYSLKHVADESCVTGWVRNLLDGAVEAMVQGAENDVQKVIEWCQMGPPSAQVDSIKANKVETGTRYQTFAIIH